MQGALNQCKSWLLLTQNLETWQRESSLVSTCYTEGVRQRKIFAKCVTKHSC